MLAYKLFLTFITVHAAFAAINGKCSSGNGVCVTTTSCTNAGGTYKSGLCPNDPNNVMCCNKSKCTVNGLVGQCKFTSACTGTSYSGACPGGNDFKCCVNKPPDKNLGAKIVAKAREYINKLDYVYGGASLTSGADCSGFVQQIYKLFGISLPRTTQTQVQEGSNVSLAGTYGVNNAKAGDLLFRCNSDGSTRHVMIYTGENSFVHAPMTGQKVSETAIGSNSNICKIRRII